MNMSNAKVSEKHPALEKSIKPESTSHFYGLEGTDHSSSILFRNQPQFGKIKRMDNNGFINVAEEILKQYQFEQSTSSSSPSIASTLGSVSPTSFSINDLFIQNAINEVVGESMRRTPRVYQRVKPEEKDSFKYIRNRVKNNEAVRRTREKNKVKKMLEEEKYEQLRKRYNSMIDALKKCTCGCATEFIMENFGKI